MLIRKATRKDAENLALAHERIFDDFFMSSLGTSFLVVYYRMAVDYDATSCFVAYDESGNCLGFVFGRKTAKGYLKRLLKRGLLRFALCGVKLLLTRPNALIRLIKNLEKKSNSKDFEDTQDYAEIGLIGVSPEYKGQGIGHRLFHAFEEDVKQRGATKISLTTDYYNNDNTLIAYKAWGFTVLYEFVTYPNRRMYRLIKTIG